MKRNKGTRAGLAITLICIGIALILASLILAKFNLSAFSSLQFSEITHTVSEPFESIRVEEIDCSVLLLPSENGECTVVTNETAHLYNSVSVENGVLTVRRYDERAWHERILVFGATDPTVRIYLPKTQYTDINLRTTAGSLHVDAPFTFRTATLRSVNGDVQLTASVTENAAVSSTSGNVLLQDLLANALSASTASGSLTLRRLHATELKLSADAGTLRLDEQVHADNLTAFSVNGNVVFMDVTVSDELLITNESGSVALFNTEFAKAYVETISGNVMGTLRTEKQFDVQTESGVILHPESTAGNGTLIVRTVSGNVSFSYLE